MRSNGKRTAPLEDLVDINLGTKKKSVKELLSVMSPFDCVNDVTLCIVDIQRVVHHTFFLMPQLAASFVFLIAQSTLCSMMPFFSGTS